MPGFDAFAASLQEPLLRHIDPAGSVPVAQLREAVALAIAAFLISFFARTWLRLWGAFVRLVRGHAQFQPTSRAALFFRRISGFCAVALPWWTLWRIHEEGHVERGWAVLAGLSLCIWLLLRAADHGGLWYDTRRGEIVLQTGFGPFRVHTQRIPLAVVFEPLTGGLLPPRDQRPPHARVRLGRQALPALCAQLNESDAKAWLKRLAIRERFVLANDRS
jgi:hypothetical protein